MKQFGLSTHTERNPQAQKVLRSVLPEECRKGTEVNTGTFGQARTPVFILTFTSQTQFLIARMHFFDTNATERKLCFDFSTNEHTLPRSKANPHATNLLIQNVYAANAKDALQTVIKGISEMTGGLTDFMLVEKLSCYAFRLSAKFQTQGRTYNNYTVAIKPHSLAMLKTFEKNLNDKRHWFTAAFAKEHANSYKQSELIYLRTKTYYKAPVCVRCNQHVLGDLQQHQAECQYVWVHFQTFLKDRNINPVVLAQIEGVLSVPGKPAFFSRGGNAIPRTNEQRGTAAQQRFAVGTCYIPPNEHDPNNYILQHVQTFIKRKDIGWLDTALALELMDHCSSCGQNNRTDHEHPHTAGPLCPRQAKSFQSKQKHNTFHFGAPHTTPILHPNRLYLGENPAPKGRTTLASEEQKLNRKHERKSARVNRNRQTHKTQQQQRTQKTAPPTAAPDPQQQHKPKAQTKGKGKNSPPNNTAARKPPEPHHNRAPEQQRVVPEKTPVSPTPLEPIALRNTFGPLSTMDSDTSAPSSTSHKPANGSLTHKQARTTAKPTQTGTPKTRRQTPASGGSPVSPVPRTPHAAHAKTHNTSKPTSTTPKLTNGPPPLAQAAKQYGQCLLCNGQHAQGSCPQAKVLKQKNEVERGARRAKRDSGSGEQTPQKPPALPPEIPQPSPQEGQNNHTPLTPSTTSKRKQPPSPAKPRKKNDMDTRMESSSGTDESTTTKRGRPTGQRKKKT